ncbi:MAG: TIGR04211 family SH3 domain-containing protein [Gammaproteobacteria bacterium]|nr:TIGR04211 family SH3 domain-containing protein [Gammaproteobacteria bacterium]
MKKILISILLLSTLNATSAIAETLYVKDVLYISMRDGPGNQYKQIKTMKTGSVLNKLEVSDDEKYIKVSTKDGLEGWIQSQYLVDTPIAALLLERAESRIDTLKNKTSKLTTELTDTKKALQDITREHTTLKTTYAKLDKENQRIKKVSKQPIAMADENDHLRSQNVSMEKELVRLKQEVQVLEDRTDREWFMIGGGVLGLGVALGLILPFFSRRKKSSAWGSM